MIELEYIQQVIKNIKTSFITKLGAILKPKIMNRRKDGRETWNRLIEWDKGQTSSERLSSSILSYEKYESIDPSHPLGGRDGLKDFICKKNDMKFIVSCYFPRSKQNFSTIKNKLKSDSIGISNNNANGIIFITNQELTLSERDQLINEINEKYIVEIYHLERITNILNTTENYGIRLEFLDIEMTKEEQLAYMANRDEPIKVLISLVKEQVKNSTNDKKSNSNAISEYNAENKQIYNCPKCKHGFMIDKKLINKSLIDNSINEIQKNDVMILSIIPTYMRERSITCPKCGNLEKMS